MLLRHVLLFSIWGYVAQSVGQNSVLNHPQNILVCKWAKDILKDDYNHENMLSLWDDQDADDQQDVLDEYQRWWDSLSADERVQQESYVSLKGKDANESPPMFWQGKYWSQLYAEHPFYFWMWIVLSVFVLLLLIFLGMWVSRLLRKQKAAEDSTQSARLLRKQKAALDATQSLGFGNEYNAERDPLLPVEMPQQVKPKRANTSPVLERHISTPRAAIITSPGVHQSSDYSPAEAPVINVIDKREPLAPARKPTTLNIIREKQNRVDALPPVLNVGRRGQVQRKYVSSPPSQSVPVLASQVSSHSATQNIPIQFDSSSAGPIAVPGPSNLFGSIPPPVPHVALSAMPRRGDYGIQKSAQDPFTMPAPHPFDMPAAEFQKHIG